MKKFDNGYVHKGTELENGASEYCEYPSASFSVTGSGKNTDAEKAGVRKILTRFAVSAVFFALGIAAGFIVPGIPASGPADRLVPFISDFLFIISWGIAGYQVFISAVRNIFRGDFFDENFLMTVATVGAFLIGEFPEGAAVMLFFNLGELFQEYAVSRSRRSITGLVDIRPEFARVLRNGSEITVNPEEVVPGETVIVRPGERVPLDGTVTEGASTFDTASLTGESIPRDAVSGEEALS
ncbi:MAG: hypothetical protein LBR47_05650, partial [Spirochaetaceae bacterium]|nr:hypothetical protein [Spirochaetaceae bacterium]